MALTANFEGRIMQNFVAPSAESSFGDGTLAQLTFRYWRMMMRRRWMVITILATALVLGLVVTLLMTPLYTATATIEIARQQDKITNVAGVTPEATGLDLEFYQTQYSLLKAHSLAERVARTLKLDSGTKLYDLYRIDPVEVERLPNQSASEFGAEQRERRMRQLSDILLSKLSIEPIRGSRLVNIRITSPEPTFSAQVANAWTRQFIETTLDRRFQSTTAARQYLEKRLEQLRVRLEQSERDLVGYASRERLVTLQTNRDDEGRTTSERSIIADDLQSLNQALALATAERVRAESHIKSPGATTTATLANIPIGQLRQRRAEVASEYAKAQSQFEPEYPTVKALASQVAALDRSIAIEEGRVSRSISGEYSEAVRRESDLREKVEDLKSSLLDQRRRSIQYNIFQREVDTNRTLYEGLLQRYKEIGVAGVGANNVSIVDAAATPQIPSSPNLLLNVILALLVGSIAAFAAVLVRDQLEDTITDLEDLKSNLGLPSLGSIPHSGDDDPVTMLNDRKSIATEAYMSLQANLQFSSDHGIPRSIVVTSTRSGEGKSTTAFATAFLLARTGRKVILVDADMRSPSVHQLLSVRNTGGLSNFLSGEDDVNSLIQTTDKSGMMAMLAGPIPPNAAELLTGPRFKELIERLTASYDHVVIDAPPVLGLADAPLIASEVEATIYTVESDGVRASLVRTAVGRLSAVNANLIGAVLTKFDPKKARFSYGYEYGYSYGGNADKD